MLIVFFKDLIYLFLDRGKGRDKERGRNLNMWLSLTYPNYRPGPKPRHVHWLGIEPVTLWCTGQCSIHWSTLVRTMGIVFKPSQVMKAPVSFYHGPARSWISLLEPHKNTIKKELESSEKVVWRKVFWVGPERVNWLQNTVLNGK